MIEIIIIGIIMTISIYLLMKIIYYNKMSEHLFKVIIEDLKIETDKKNIIIPKRLFTLNFNNENIIYKGIILGISNIIINSKPYYILFVKDTPFYLLFFDFFLEIFYKPRTLYIIDKKTVITDFKKVLISLKNYNLCGISDYNKIYYSEDEEIITALLRDKSYKIFATNYAPITQLIRKKPRSYKGIEIEKHENEI